MNPDIDFDKEKILELLYAGDVANDLLAYEIITKLEDKSFFILPMVGAVFFPTSEKMAQIYFDFLQPYLLKEQHDFLKYPIQEGMVDWEGWSYYRKTFSDEQLIELSYFSIRRCNSGFFPFLILDNGEHPERKFVFDHFKNQNISTHLNLTGLFPNEVDEYLEEAFLQNLKLEFRYLKIEHHKQFYFPKLLLKAKIEWVIYRIPIMNKFVNELLEIQGVKRLSIIIGKETVLPTDWSKFSSLENLDFGGADYVFENIDFVNQCPNLKIVSISGSHNFSHPDILLRTHAVFQTGAQFISTEGFEVNDKNQLIRPFVNFVSGVLGQSDFSIEKQKYYLRKLNNHDLSAFTYDELEELSSLNLGNLNTKIDAHLSMSKFYPDRNKK